MAPLFAWLNLAVLVATVFLVHLLYVRSVRPAKRAEAIGDLAYDLCARGRFIASLLMCVHVLSSIVYRIFPPPIGLPASLPWPWWVSLSIAGIIAVPCGYLLWRGVHDAGEEALRPRKEHGLYTGIYDKIRHPQAVGERPTAHEPGCSYPAALRGLEGSRSRTTQGAGARRSFGLAGQP